MDPEKFAKVEIRSPIELWEWLETHHGSTESVWLVTWKAAHRARYVSRDQVLDALVAFGWIDGRRMKLDDERTMQLISPRKQQVWAKTYKDRAIRLEEEGRMQPSGRDAWQRSERSGRINAMAAVDDFVEPQGLVDALWAVDADAWWRGAAPSYRRNILRWIASAKRTETVEKRIAIAVAHAKAGQKVPNY